MLKPTAIVIATVAVIGITGAQAQGRGPRDGSGPVGSACADAIQSYCAGKQHGDRSVRNCLEGQRSKLSASCKAALDGTGGGRGRR